jgi:hypothetical protein
MNFGFRSADRNWKIKNIDFVYRMIKSEMEHPKSEIKTS